MVFLFQVMPQSSPTMCVEGDEFGPLAVKPRIKKSEMVFLFQVMPHSSPTICAKSGEFALTQSLVNDGESTQSPTHPFAFVIAATFC